MKHVVSWNEAAELLKQGAVGVIPTDTVYGVVASAANQEAVGRLYELKKREGKPGTVIASSIDQLVELGVVRRYLTAVSHYWPNSISVIVPYEHLPYIHLGKGAVATRIPADEALRDFLEKTGPLLTSSANHPGELTAINVAQAMEIFGDTVDFYVDGGDLSKAEPSTIIQIIDDAVDVIREGAVKINEKGEIV